MSHPPTSQTGPVYPQLVHATPAGARIIETEPGCFVVEQRRGWASMGESRWLPATPEEARAALEHYQRRCAGSGRQARVIDAPALCRQSVGA